MAEALARRSLLFVPGARPDRFGKALEAGADVVCIDLEDSVPPEGKAAAREAALRFAAERAGDRGLMLRLNSLRSVDGLKDMAALVEAHVPTAAIMFPKVNTAQEIAWADELLGAHTCGIVPIIETAEGLANARAIAKAPRVEAFLFGAVDLVADLRCELSWEPLLFARSTLVAAAAEAGIELFDVPHIDVADDEGLRESTRRAKALGMTARAAIHPKQVAIINAVFTPSEAEIARAKAIVEALAAAKGAAALLNGKLIEKPVALSAERLLKIAARLS
jgi:citrate lyase beta subunit